MGEAVVHHIGGQSICSDALPLQVLWERGAATQAKSLCSNRSSQSKTYVYKVAFSRRAREDLDISIASVLLGSNSTAQVKAIKRWQALPRTCPNTAVEPAFVGYTVQHLGDSPMNTEELTQVVTAHQSAISRQGQWQAEHETRMARVEAILERLAQQQEQQQEVSQERFNRIEAILEQTAQAISLNREDIAQLTGNIESLRNQVADWMSSRNPPT